MSRPAALALPARRFVVVCFGFDAARLRKQPWHVANGIATGLTELGHDVVLITDSVKPPIDRSYRVLRARSLFAGDCVSDELRRGIARIAPEQIFIVTGALRLARMAPLQLGAPVSLLMASPRLRMGELLRLGLGGLWSERRVLARPLLETLLPGAVLCRGFQRSGAADIVYFSEAARARYMHAGLPAGRRLVPQVAVPAPTRVRADISRTIVYLGPPLAARGADLAVTAFEQAVALGLRARLLMLLRPDAGADHGATARLVSRCTASPCHDLITCETHDLPADDLRRRIAASHAFLLPFRVTISEVPLVLIEAGLSGRPIVVLDTPGVTEIAEAFGGIVASSPEALPGALMEACGRSDSPKVDASAWTRWDHAVRGLVEPSAQPLSQVAMIALSGVDGSGKTHLAGLMLDRLALAGIPHRQIWSRFRNYLSKPLLAVTRLTGHNRKETVGKVRTGYHDFSRNPLLAWGFLALQTIDLTLDILIRFRLRRKGTIVADRCAIDSLVDLAVDTGLDEVVLDRLGPRLLRLLPQPLLAVVVERSPALIAAQRPDVLTDRHFARRRALYARLAERLHLPVLRNDASPDAAMRELSRLLVAAPPAIGADR